MFVGMEVHRNRSQVYVMESKGTGGRPPRGRTGAEDDVPRHLHRTTWFGFRHEHETTRPPLMGPPPGDPPISSPIRDY
jgi:hypothetical protein